MDEMIDVEEKWYPPDMVSCIVDAKTGMSMVELFPDGIFVRQLAKSGTILELQNATREEAENQMFGNLGVE